MYIPNWLIIVSIVIVVLFLYIRKKRNDRLYNDVIDSPVSEKNINKIFQKYYKNVGDTSNIKKIRIEREHLADDLNLGDRLFQFTEDIRYYPNWYDEGARSNAPFRFSSWHSSTVPPGHIKSVNFSESKCANHMREYYNFNDEDKVIEYGFSDYSEYLYLIIYPSLTDYDRYIPIVVIKDNDENMPTIYLKAKLYYKHYITDDYLYYEIEEFKPDDWIEVLLKIMVDVRREEKTFKFIYDICNTQFERPNSWTDISWDDYKNTKYY